MSPSISMSSPDSSPSRLPIRQKGSLTFPDLPKLDLPPLPEITNPAIRNLALTHSSAHAGDKTRKRDLIYNQAEAVLDNEKLEHVGDGLLTAAVITLLHELYPAFGPGPATYLRSHMVSNRSLAQIAEQYGLPQMFIANASSKYMIQAAQKTKGSLFEAYVAGVYYSFLMPREEADSEESEEAIRPTDSGSTSGDVTPQAGPVGGGEGEKEDAKEKEKQEVSVDVVEQVKSGSSGKGTGIDYLFSIGLKTPQPVKRDEYNKESEQARSLTPISESPTSPHSPSSTRTPKTRTHGQAFDHLCSWLWPLFTPVAEFLSSYLETESSLSLTNNRPTLHPNQIQNVPNEWKTEDANATGAIGALNQYLGKTYGCGYLPTWITKKRVMDVWRMVCIVRTPEGKECRAEGKRLTKKAAMTVAAYKVWQEVKAWEEEQAEKRRAEEEAEDSEEGEEEVMILKERRPRGGRKSEAGVTDDVADDQNASNSITPGKDAVGREDRETDDDKQVEVKGLDERKDQVDMDKAGSA